MAGDLKDNLKKCWIFWGQKWSNMDNLGKNDIFSRNYPNIIQPFLKLGLMLGGGKGDLKLSGIYREMKCPEDP